MWVAEMPAYSAACLLWPTVVMRKPIVVRAITNQITTAATTARKKPSGRPQTSGISADGWMSGVREMAPASGSWNGPLAPTRYSVMLTRMALSMIVVITSCAPR